MMRSGALVLAGNSSAALWLFARNIALARLLPVEDYGIAMTFAIAVAAVELATDLAADRLLVQAKDGDRPALQSTLQTFEILRGAGVALILYLSAGWIAGFTHAGEAVFAYQILALVPLIRGFQHLDVFRAERAGRFGPNAMASALGAGAGALSAVVLALWLRDYRAMLASILIQHLAATLLSHVVATRPYRLSWDGEIVRRMMAFGWPLMLNGGLMFLILNADRLLVANRFGLVALGLFGAAFTLTLTPTLVIGRTLQTLLLPMLSRRRHRCGAFAPAALAAVEASLLAGLLFAVAAAIAGPSVFVLLFGERFAPAASAVVLLAVMQGVRVAKSGPSCAAVACGETTNPFVANVVRMLAVPVAVAAVVLGGAGIETLIAIGTVGEALSLATSLLLLRRRLGVPVEEIWLPLSLALATFAGIALEVLLAPPVAGDAGFAEVRAALLILAVVGTLLSMRRLRSRATRTSMVGAGGRSLPQFRR